MFTTHLYLYSRMCVSVCVCISRSVVSDSVTLWTVAPPSFSVQRILQARILEWGAIAFSRASPQPRDRSWISHTAGGFFTTWATRDGLIRRLNDGTQWFWGGEMENGSQGKDLQIWVLASSLIRSIGLIN